MQGLSKLSCSAAVVHITKPRLLQTACVRAGYIKLQLPVFHIGYFKNTLQILQVRACTVVAIHTHVVRPTVSLLHPLMLTKRFVLICVWEPSVLDSRFEQMAIV